MAHPSIFSCVRTTLGGNYLPSCVLEREFPDFYVSRCSFLVKRRRRGRSDHYDHGFEEWTESVSRRSGFHVSLALVPLSCHVQREQSSLSSTLNALSLVTRSPGEPEDPD